MHITAQEHALQYLGEFITITKWLSSEYLIKLNYYLGSLNHHLSCSLKGRWGIKDDRAITFLHSSLLSAFRRASPNPNPDHYDTLSSHLFNVCLSFPLLEPCPVGSSLQVLLIFLMSCAHTISICVFSEW